MTVKRMNLEMSSKSYEAFKDFFNLLKLVNDELTLNVDETGITAIGMDPTHVAMIDAKILPGLFENYEQPAEEKLTVNLMEFSKFLDRIGKDESPKIQYSAEEARLVLLASKGGNTRRFSIPVLEPLDDEVPKPKIFFKSTGRILTKSMIRAIKDSNLVSEHVKFDVNATRLAIIAKGDMGSATNEFEGGGDELLELKAEENATATYTLSYLTDMFGALGKLADVVTIELSTDMPMKIEATCNNPSLEVTLYLAPCIGV